MSGSRFYTRRGDDGCTGLLGPDRVPKNDPRPEAYGTVDEAQAALGLARASGCSPGASEILVVVQRDLYILMAELASAGDDKSPFRDGITARHVEQLELWIAELEKRIEMPREFVIPGDSQCGAALHLARTIVRRAERLVVSLVNASLLRNKQIVRYLNRLSSLAFVLAVAEDGRATDGSATLAKEQ